MPEEEWVAGLVADLGMIAEWNRLVGREGELLLIEDYSITEPKHVRDARGRVLGLTTIDVLPPLVVGAATDSVASVGEAASVLERALEPFDERSIDILRSRVFADAPEGLESIGDRYGVTRERIRQLEAKARASLVAAVEAGPLGSVAATLRERATTVRALADILDTLPAIAEAVPSLGQPVWRVLDRLDTAYEIRDGWCASPTIEAAIGATSAAVHSMFGEDGFVAYDEVIAADAVQADESWLRRCGFSLLDGYVLPASASVNVRAAIVLTVAGEPLESDVIHSRLGVERSLGSLKNAMSVDPRFARVDRDAFALAEWGFDSYQSIRQLIGRALDAAGGSMQMARLIDALTSEFSVSPRSVTAYASALPFQTSGGIVRRANVSERPKAPAGRKPLQRLGSAYVVPTIISTEHLRGSGSQLPLAIIEVLGLEYGDTRELPSPRGSQPVSWKSPQPTLGSIRRFCEGEIVDGAEVLLVFGDDGTFDVRLASADVPASTATVTADAGDLRAALIDIFAHLVETHDVWTAQTYPHDMEFGPYVQALHEFDGGYACEVSSNAFLHPALSDAKQQALAFLGWQAPQPAQGLPNYHRAFPAGTEPAEVAELFVRTLFDVFELDGSDVLEFGPRSPELDAFVSNRLDVDRPALRLVAKDLATE